jgi:hypothetical protein
LNASSSARASACSDRADIFSLSHYIITKQVQSNPHRFALQPGERLLASVRFDSVAELEVDLFELAGGERIWKSNNYVDEARTFKTENRSSEAMSLDLHVRHQRGRPSAHLPWHDSHIREQHLSDRTILLEAEDEGLSEATIIQDGDWNDAVIELKIQKASPKAVN